MFQVSSGPVTLDGTFFPDGSLSFGLASAPRNNRPLHSTRLPSAINVNDFDAGATLNGGSLQMNGAQGGTLLQFAVDQVVVVQTAP
jgi:hypothetical protein